MWPKQDVSIVLWTIPIFEPHTVYDLIFFVFTGSFSYVIISEAFEEKFEKEEQMRLDWLSNNTDEVFLKNHDVLN